MKSGFPNDYALAIADTASQTSTSQMLYVQIPSAFRAQWGLKTNPTLMGKQIDVTGALAAYFSHPGMTSASAFALAGGTTPPTDPPPTGSSPWDPTYYAPAIGKTGTALRNSLHDIIDGNTRLSYDQVWTALKDTDQDPNNTANVIELYTGRSIAKTNNGGGSGQWNREHVWAQSRGGFSTSAGPGTDLHHLRPEDVSVNGTRGNKDFDLGGSAVSGCSDCFSDADSFEPRDAVQGDVARMLFYMAIRYEGGDGFNNLEMSSTVGTSSSRARRPRDAAGVERRRPGVDVRDASQRPHPLGLAGQPQPVHRPPRVGSRDLELSLTARRNVPGRPTPSTPGCRRTTRSRRSGRGARRA